MITYRELDIFSFNKGMPVRLAFLAILTLSLMAGCAAPLPPKSGEIYHGQGWQAIEPDRLDELIKEARVAVVGERHANPDDHLLQLKTLRLMADRHPGLVVGIEWLDLTAQEQCDRLSRAEISVADFAREVDWTQKWGHNFAAYEPIFQEIRDRKLRLVALNAPLSIVRQIARKGLASLSPEQKGQIAAQMQLDDPAYFNLISEQFQGHGVISREARENFLAAQISRDETMAQRFAKALSPWPHGGNHGVLFVGRGHVEMNLGLVPRLERRLPGPPKLVILPLSAHEAAQLRAAGESPMSGQVWVITKAPHPRQRGRLGLVLKKAENGLRIIHVMPQSPAEKAGLKVGDVLSALDGNPLENSKSIHDHLKSKPFAPHVYSIIRDGEAFTRTITLPREGKQDQ